MNTATLKIPTIAGTPFAGGIYAGRYFIGAQPIALIIAPKDEGDFEDVAWNTKIKAVTGALSYADGFANTVAMAAAGSALAKQARALTIDGCDDWYLPSRLESLIAFGELKGMPAFDFEDTWYWTSTQSASYSVCAWYQYFFNGYQGSTRKGSRFRARAVRRFPI